MKDDKKTHWKKNFNYDYHGSYSLMPEQEVVLTISKVGKETVTGSGGSKEECTVCHFSEAINGEKKPMILNKTNCKTIEKLYGTPFIEDWVGKRVTVYVEQGIKAFGDVVDALRIRPSIPSDKVRLFPGHPKWKDVETHYEKHGNLKAVLKHYEISPEDMMSL